MNKCSGLKISQQEPIKTKKTIRYIKIFFQENTFIMNLIITNN